MTQAASSSRCHFPQVYENGTLRRLSQHHKERNFPSRSFFPYLGSPGGYPVALFFFFNLFLSQIGIWFGAHLVFAASFGACLTCVKLKAHNQDSFLATYPPWFPHLHQLYQLLSFPRQFSSQKCSCI